MYIFIYLYVYIYYNIPSKTIVVRCYRKQVFDSYHGERFLSGKPLRNSRLYHKNKNTRLLTGVLYY